MPNFIQLQEDIIDELEDHGAVTRDHVQKAIVRSIRQYERKNLWFTQAETSFNTVAGQEYYDEFPNPLGGDDLLFSASAIEIFTVKRASDCATLPGLPMSEIEAMQAGETGTPTAYTTWGGQIRLYPVPTAVEQIDVTFSRRFDELEADADTNNWLDHAEELIRQAAKRRLAMDILHDDELATRCAMAESQALDGLQEETRRRRGNRLLRASPMPVMAGSFNVVTGQ